MGFGGHSTRRRAADNGLAGLSYRVARRWDSVGLRILDVFAVGGAWLIAGLAGFNRRADAASFHHLVWFVGIPILVCLAVNQAAGLYGPVWRYASIDEAVRVLLAVVVGTLLSATANAVAASVQGVGISSFETAPIASFFALLGIGGIRFQSRFFAIERQRTRDDASLSGTRRRRAVIVGAGDAGAALAYELRALGSESDMVVVGFVDDDPRMARRSVRGLPVLGPSRELASICQAHDIETVLVTSSDSESRKEVLAHALAADTQVKVLPPTSERVAGPIVRGLRDLDVTDVLGRPHAPVDSDEIGVYLAGATVLITGAGGSIGSEIVRQVAAYGPRRLILLDREETLLHDIQLENVDNAEAVLADITDAERINRIFAHYRPDIVFHAAAQKHVPLLELHPLEAVRTNVIGTWIVATAAAEHGCTSLVHISTDKAAEPYSVMGATKRVAEQIVFEVGRRYDRRYVAVRFGNVLGTRGSVVPTFLRQILDGGPVTVTSPDMTRFFMTVTEAVSLVLQAGAMAVERSIFLLDMGEPVSILSLAHQMIRLAGLRPGRDVPITIVGLRPGERLEERLFDRSENVEPAAHPSIAMLVPKLSHPWDSLECDIDDLAASIQRCDDHAALKLIKEILAGRGVACHIDLPADATEEQGHFEMNDPSIGHSPRVGGKLAVLGGEPSFPGQIPFVRPVRPPLEQLTARLATSYASGILTNGALVAELEEKVAARLGVPFVVAVNSCTSGLILTLQALTEGRDGPVVLPSFTFSATGLAVVWNGRIPRFVGSDPDTFQIDLHSALDALDGASALVGTHVFGAPCQPGAVEQLGRSAGLPVLFDAAHAFGSKTNGTAIGGFGDAEVFSLTPTKTLVAGEGGLVATRDAALAHRLRVARNYGNEGDYNTAFAGLNARLSEFHAAMALESLELLDASLATRRQMADRYRRLLADVPGVRCQSIPDTDESTYKDFTIRIDADTFGLTRDDLVRVLSREGVETRNYFDPPLHRQTVFARAQVVDGLRTVEELSEAVVSLPIYPDLPAATLEQIVDLLAVAHDNAEEIVAALADTAAAQPTDSLA